MRRGRVGVESYENVYLLQYQPGTVCWLALTERPPRFDRQAAHGRRAFRVGASSANTEGLVHTHAGRASTQDFLSHHSAALSSAIVAADATNILNAAAALDHRLLSGRHGE